MTKYEVGPIRPPSEASSLIVRVTRNCPWNRCTFCPVYKGQDYEQRAVSEVLEDIKKNAPRVQASKRPYKSVFLQDEDPMGLPTADLIPILIELRKNYPTISKITTYARTASLIKKSPDEIRELYEAGLTRIHRGLETGYNPLLRFVKKGTTAKLQIKGGRRVKEAGMELSEYVMPGLAGDLIFDKQPAWRNHAIETANVLNEINPDFIRLRTLSIYPGDVSWNRHKQEGVSRLTDQDIAKEIYLFIENLNGITSTIKSDHRLNLLWELRGKLPRDKNKMLALIDQYLSMKPIDQYAFRIGALLGGPATLDRFAAANGVQLITDDTKPASGKKTEGIETEENEYASLENLVQALLTMVV